MNDGSAETINPKLIEFSKIYTNVEYLTLNTEHLYKNAPFYKDELIYYDKNHLNQIGADLYGKMSLDAFSNLMHVIKTDKSI
ncbi:hypothetical protein [uncultured Endozoicomonas sp.]|uniref:hypothetical protein n=1 Tax=uncultured Endozoicomonas sp. TaxID=432652 RepID=UPI00261E5CA0|nr:hypothetical protein [uncultured Endozoicomonas sp.]